MIEHTAREATEAMRRCHAAALRGEKKLQTTTLPEGGMWTTAIQALLDRAEDRSLRNRLCARLLMVQAMRNPGR